MLRNQTSVTYGRTSGGPTGRWSYLRSPPPTPKTSLGGVPVESTRSETWWFESWSEGGGRWGPEWRVSSWVGWWQWAPIWSGRRRELDTRGLEGRPSRSVGIQEDST